MRQALRSCLFSALLLGAMPALAAETVAETVRAGAWAVHGAAGTLSLNAELLEAIGVSMVGSHAEQRDGQLTLPVSARTQGALEFDAPYGHLQRFTGGSLQFEGPLRLDYRGGSIDLSDFRLRPRAGTERDLELVDADQVAWFYLDHVHYELLAGGQSLSMRNLDLRISPDLAKRIGDPQQAGLAIGSMELVSSVFQGPGTQPQPESCADPNWHGKLIPGGGGAIYQADVKLESMSSLDYKRCQNCDGPGGANDGNLVFAPNATLRNSNNPNFHADVPWYTKFSTSPPPGAYPYGSNDQHPYLIWNIYRLDADGRFQQIGRSGVKHAFLTINVGCTVNCGDSHILGLNCGDTYSSGNNDSSSSLGPRSEIIPSKGLWGRCGSVYDSNCDGSNDNPNLGSYDNRLQLRESQIEASSNPGAQYFYEGWYVIRDDIDIYNTMGYRRFTPSFGSVWSAGSQQAFVLGPALNVFVNHANPGPNARSVELEGRNSGHIRLAMRATQLPSGSWRYDYAVMNFDYTETQTSGAEPNLRILSNRGLVKLSVQTSSAPMSTLFRDGDTNAGNDWIMTSDATGVQFSAPPSGNDLFWGTLYSFSIESEGAPVDGTVSVYGAGGAELAATVLVPGAVPPLYANGFE